MSPEMWRAAWGIHAAWPSPRSAPPTPPTSPRSPASRPPRGPPPTPISSRPRPSPSWRAPRPPQAWTAAVAEGVVFVATEGDWTVGFAAAGPADVPAESPLGPEAWGEIGALLVEPRWGRRGHGGRLLAAAAEALRERGARYGLAWVPEKDDASLRFYMRARVGARRHGPGARHRRRRAPRGPLHRLAGPEPHRVGGAVSRRGRAGAPGRRSGRGAPAPTGRPAARRA